MWCICASEDIDPNNPPIYAYIPELGDLDEDPDDEDDENEKGDLPPHGMQEVSSHTWEEGRFILKTWI